MKEIFRENETLFYNIIRIRCKLSQKVRKLVKKGEYTLVIRKMKREVREEEEKTCRMFRQKMKENFRENETLFYSTTRQLTKKEKRTHITNMKLKTKVRKENEVVENVWTKDGRKFEENQKLFQGAIGQPGEKREYKGYKGGIKMDFRGNRRE